MKKFLFTASLIFFTACQPALGARIYMSNEQFVNQAFAKNNKIVPKVSKLWLTGELKNEIKALIGHPYRKIRLRYWKQDQQTVWILEEIGKERPITFGVSVVNHQIDEIKVLAFRESRGGEIAMPVYEQQFSNLSLNANNRLNRNIDGISGATMSVTAMKKMAQLALYLHNKVTHKKAP